MLNNCSIALPFARQKSEKKEFVVKTWNMLQKEDALQKEGMQGGEMFEPRLSGIR